MAGAELEANYPVSVITDGMGLNITVMSYSGAHGLRDRRRPRPDARRLGLIDWLGDELEALSQPASPSPTPSATSIAASVPTTRSWRLWSVPMSYTHAAIAKNVM